MANILVLGAGFGGLYTALQAHQNLRDRAAITVLDRNDHFLFTPLLFQVAGGTLEARHVARPLAKLLPRPIRFVQTTVQGINLECRHVETNTGAFPYDFLVLALGGVPNFYGIASAEQHALPFKWLPDVERLRAHIERRFADAERSPQRAPDLLRFVVTGAGCTGVELIAELHDWMRGPLLRQYPGVRGEAVQLVLAEALDHLLCPMEPRLMRAALRKLLTRKIDVRLGNLVTDVGLDWLRLQPPQGDEIQIACGGLVWTAGIQAPPLVAELPVPHGPAGRVHVSPTMQIPGYPEVLAVGDLAACPDPRDTYLPATAQVAVQQGPAAARVLAALVQGKEPIPFRYRRKGEVVGLGRMGALAEAFGFPLMGLPAWLFARTVHLARLPDWGDRVAVAWAWAKQELRVPRRAGAETLDRRKPRRRMGS